MSKHGLRRVFSIALLGGLVMASATAYGDAADLVGTWYDQDPEEDISVQYIFRADGTLSIVENPGAPGEVRVEGTYTATDTELVMTLPDTPPAEFTYYASDTLLSLGALLPVGSHDGVVGTWEGRDPEGRTRIEMRADNTLTYSFWAAGETDPEVLQGSYEQPEPGVYEVTLRPAEGDPIIFYLELIDDSALNGITFSAEPPAR